MFQVYTGTQEFENAIFIPYTTIGHNFKDNLMKFCTETKTRTDAIEIAIQMQTPHGMWCIIL